MNLSFLTTPGRFEPGRPVYVLMSHDKTHVYCLPNGEADWSYNRADMELRVKILNKDFSDFNYSVLPLSQAIIHITNHQAELEKAWTPIISQIKRARRLKDRWNVYHSALKRYGAHPISQDALLRELCQID